MWLVLSFSGSLWQAAAALRWLQEAAGFNLVKPNQQNTPKQKTTGEGREEEEEGRERRGEEGAEKQTEDSIAGGLVNKLAASIESCTEASLAQRRRSHLQQ